ncbi:MAG: D-arabinose 5-phosphate isomerase [Gammaproteobacteria bacterium SG8_31]|jgi:arabinose-5-phosphate isomerase|nr:MAG: D-arabinose 5-phosphate isomerase [Gammaproteobacteria bacterium SG8_31]
MKSLIPERVIERAKAVVDVEADAVRGLLSSIGPEFVKACEICLGCRGRIVVTGMGKSGHIAGKIAATLASTGSPSFFVHPGEASHGDLGMITAQDVVLAVSNSGDTPEIVLILPLIKRLSVPLITMTGRPESTLARAADVNLHTGVDKEACPLNLAPTASTTATLAMGDALAVTLLECREFTEEDFARSHPGGALGRRLLLRVADIMRTGERIPKVNPSAAVSEGLFEMTRTGLGMTGIVDEEDGIIGIFTDGDLRRAIDRNIDLSGTSIGDVMTRGCKTVTEDMLAAEAVRIMEDYSITALLVADAQNRLIGALNIHDLLHAGVV